MDDDTKITLIGTQLAREGLEFIFEKGAPECEKCKFKSTCLDLERGRKYRITGIRSDKVQECFVHEEGAYVVEVEMAPIVAIIESRNAVEGATIRYKAPNCETEDPAIYELCHPAGLKEGDKCIISKLFGPVEIDDEENLKKVELKLA
ncbi:UPF0179 family protein [Methanohalophilus sp.]|uniref:UPF0179 family protein n=1 Tax=Methanohalophilus sp. TaxID=1966352 RepID=UPI0026213114|nr:UPF0179 family protein [Methanohalophilus sp.]MDK2893077.1 uncharacterized protein [Methanohalophilus sp.]